MPPCLYRSGPVYAGHGWPVTSQYAVVFYIKWERRSRVQPSCWCHLTSGLPGWVPKSRACSHAHTYASGQWNQAQCLLHSTRHLLGLWYRYYRGWSGWAVGQSKYSRVFFGKLEEGHISAFVLSSYKTLMFVFFSPTQDIPTVDGPIPLPTSIAVSSSIQSSLLMPSHMGHPFLSMAPHCTVNLPAPYHKPISSYSLGLDTFSSPLDSLDSLSISESPTGALLIMAS